MQRKMQNEMLFTFCQHHPPKELHGPGHTWQSNVINYHRGPGRVSGSTYCAVPVAREGPGKPMGRDLLFQGRIQISVHSEDKNHHEIACSKMIPISAADPLVLPDPQEYEQCSRDGSPALHSLLGTSRSKLGTPLLHSCRTKTRVLDAQFTALGSPAKGGTNVLDSEIALFLHYSFCIPLKEKYGINCVIKVTPCLHVCFRSWMQSYMAHTTLQSSLILYQ